MKPAVVSCLVTLMFATLCLTEASPQVSDNDVAIELLLKRLLEKKSDSNAAVENVAVENTELNSKELMKGTRDDVRCLRDIEVFYTSIPLSNPPDDTIWDAQGVSNDINYGVRSAKYNSWLKSSWQFSRSYAVTNIEIIITNNKRSGYSDMAANSGGAYRYLNLKTSETASRCITEIKLWRGSSAADTPDKSGWHGYSTNINAGREGGFLYLAWSLG